MYSKLIKNFPSSLITMASQCKSPIITIGGSQLTGKSTVAKSLSREFNGDYVSAGSLFRQESNIRGISVQELSRQEHAKNVDKTIELNMLKHFADDKCVVMEGRLPSVLGTMLKSLGRNNVYRIYLQCTIKEQTLRYIKREIGSFEYEIAKSTLENQSIQSIGEVTSSLKSLSIPIDIDLLIRNLKRDEDDIARFISNYGDYSNYKSSHHYDFILDTSPNTPEETFSMIIAELVSNCNFLNHFGINNE